MTLVLFLWIILLIIIFDNSEFEKHYECFPLDCDCDSFSHYFRIEWIFIYNVSSWLIQKKQISRDDRQLQSYVKEVKISPP